MNTLTADLQAGINAVIEKIKADYKAMQGRSAEHDRAHKTAEEVAIGDRIRKEMFEELESNLRYDIGKKYAKIVRNGSAHSFVMMADDAKFKRGDILMAASWQAPARNFARGNVVTGDLSRVTWSGVI